MSIDLLKPVASRGHGPGPCARTCLICHPLALTPSASVAAHRAGRLTRAESADATAENKMDRESFFMILSATHVVAASIPSQPLRHAPHQS